MAVRPAEQPLERLKQQLHVVGLRATGPRIAVLRELTAAAAPLSHGDLTERLDGTGFDRATIYRNLIDLTDAGLARRFDSGDHIWRFELAERAIAHRAHPHFVCIDCGTVQCLPRSVVTVAEETLSKRDPELEIQLRGRCDSCAD